VESRSQTLRVTARAGKLGVSVQSTPPLHVGALALTC
jgi:hypothetical protein